MPARLTRLLKAAEWLMVASLAPVLLVMFAILLFPVAADAVKTRWTTGAWPRNQEFIARQKVRGLLGRFRKKPTSDDSN